MPSERSPSLTRPTINTHALSCTRHGIFGAEKKSYSPSRGEVGTRADRGSEGVITIYFLKLSCRLSSITDSRYVTLERDQKSGLSWCHLLHSNHSRHRRLGDRRVRIPQSQLLWHQHPLKSGFDWNHGRGVSRDDILRFKELFKITDLELQDHRGFEKDLLLFIWPSSPT
jgi:hypothetical protein